MSSVLTAARDRVRAAYVAVFIRLSPTVLRWWSNPLFHHARRQKGLPLRALRTALPIAAAVSFLLSILLWLVNFRLGAAILVGLSIGVVLATVLAAPAACARHALMQLRHLRQNPAALADLPAEAVNWGLALSGLWRLRWWIVVALALTPALVVGVLRLDASTYAVLRLSARDLGAATDAAVRAADLLPGGRMPVVRLALRAVSAGLLPWLLLPGLSLLGVGAAHLLDDLLMALLAALLGGVLVAVVCVLLWSWLSATPLLHGPFEVMRLLLLATYLAGLGYAAHRLNHQLTNRMS